jgi:type I restriction enzyme, S subunit
MSNWRRIDNIITYYGKGVTPKYVDESSIIVLNQKCIRNNKIDYSFAQYIDDSKEYNKDKYLRVGDILINSTGQGTAGRVAMIEFIPEGKSLIVDSHILILRTKSIYESKCLNYSLFSIENILQTYIDGSTGQGEFDRVRLFNIQVSYSENESTQQKISSVLSVLDDKIELNNKINTELEQMAKTFYDYWFVQFDFPNAKGKPYKSSGGKMVYNEVLKREVPQGWEVKKVKQIANTGSGGTPKSTEKIYYDNGTIPWINSGELNNSFIVKTDNFITELGMNNSNAKLFPEKTILMAMYGATAGKTSIVSFKTTTNQAVCAVMPNETEMFYYIKFALDGMYKYLINLSTGSARDNLSQEKIRDLDVIVPEREVAILYSKFVSPLFEKIKSNLQQNQQLAPLRDWLLPMLMNGQAKVTGKHAQKELLSIAAEAESEYKKQKVLNIPISKKGFAKQVLAGKIVSLFKDDPHFSDIKFQKIQFLAEHIIQADLNLNYYYQAAGPYDNIFMHTIYNALKKNKWYDYKNRKFTALEKQVKIDEYFQGYFGDATGKLDKLFRLLENETEATSEIIATIYAVWNNFIIEIKPVTDAALIEGFYSWSQRKQQYTKSQVLEGLQWLRTNHLEPTGFGKLVKKAKGKK